MFSFLFGERKDLVTYECLFVRRGGVKDTTHTPPTPLTTEKTKMDKGGCEKKGDHQNKKMPPPETNHHQEH